MTRKVLVAMSVMSLAAVAAAGTIEVSLVQVDTSDAAGLSDVAVDPAEWAAAGYLVYDLVVTVAGDDMWTVAGAYADLTNGAFWEHPQGGDLQPDPDFFTFFGLLKYDSFWTSSEEYPNPDLDPNEQATIFAPGSPLLMDATNRDAEWFIDSSPPNAGDGTYTIARYTFLPEGNGEFCVWGNVYLASTGGLEYPFACCVFWVAGDCNANGIPDECDLDCGDPNGYCDVPGCGQSTDCNGNTVPDECDIADCDPNDPACQDCNGNDIPDECDIADGTSNDWNGNGVPDECEDCQPNGIPDFVEIEYGWVEDCNGNEIPDECDIRDCDPNDPNDAWCGDCNGNGIPDGCDADPNDPDGDGVIWQDCIWGVADGVPDVCQCIGDIAIPPDNAVAIQDLAVLLAYYGITSGATYGQGDLDCDGDVELSDLAALLANYGTTCD